MNPKKKRRVRTGWTCCDDCHSFHRTKLACRLHWLWLQFRGALRWL